MFAAIVIAGGRKLLVVRLLETRPFVAAAVVSYSAFPWHHPVINWLQRHGLTLAGWDGLLVNLVAVGVVVGALSTLTYRFIERPALRRKHSTPGTRTVSAPVPAPAEAIVDAAGKPQA